MKVPAWHEARPDLVDEIRTDLRQHYPNLHLFIEGGRAEIRGTFPVRDPSGRELDRYAVTIVLPSRFPFELPIVRETGGRIPCRGDNYHVEADGIACVLIQDERWRCFPIGAPFRQYLDGPLFNYFLGQSLIARGGEWPFGEWGHGEMGLVEYCEEVLQLKGVEMLPYLRALGKSSFKKHWACPCGSGQKARACCKAKILDLRTKISPASATRALRYLERQQRIKQEAEQLKATDD